MKLHWKFCSTDNAEKIESPLQGTIVISTGFFFVFSAFMSIQSLQNSLNIEAGLGVKSLACLYSTSIVSSFLAPTFIKILGGKLTVMAAFCCHVIYTASNFYPKFYTLIPSSLLLGLATGPLWTSQNLFIAASAERIASKQNKDLIHVLNRLNGIFFSMLGIAFAGGGIVSSVIFREDISLEEKNYTKMCGVDEQMNYVSRDMSMNSTLSKQKPDKNLLMQLFGVYLGFDVIGLIITTLLLPTLPISDWTKKKSVLKSIFSMISALSNIRLLLFLPLSVIINIQRMVVYADFTRAYVTCPYGVGMVGFVMAGFAISNTVSLQIMPTVVKNVKRKVVIGTAAVGNFVEVILWLFWNPSTDQLFLVFLSGIGLGIIDSVWRLEIFGVIPIIFSDSKEPVFANVQFWRSVMATIYFGSSSYLNVFTKLVACVSILFTSLVLYGILEIMKERDRESSHLHQDQTIELTIK